MDAKLLQEDKDFIKHILSMTNFNHLGMTPDELAQALILAFKRINQAD